MSYDEVQVSKPESCCIDGFELEGFYIGSMNGDKSLIHCFELKSKEERSIYGSSYIDSALKKCAPLTYVKIVCQGSEVTKSGNTFWKFKVYRDLDIKYPGEDLPF